MRVKMGWSAVNGSNNRREFLTNLALGGGTGMLLGSRVSAEAQPKLPSSPKAPGRRVDPEIKDIGWQMGPPMPYACKGQAQAVIGESLIGTGGAQLMQKLPPEFNHRLQPLLTNQHVFEGLYMPWGRAAWRLDTRTLKYEILPPAPVGFHWPMGVAVGRDFYVFTGYIRPADERDRQELKGRVGSSQGKSVWQIGFHLDVDGTSNRIFRLSKRSGRWQWQEMPSLRIGRFLPGAAVAGTTIVVVGGAASFGAAPFAFDYWGGNINAVEAFDTAAPEKGWTELPPIPWMGRESMAPAGIGNNIYVFGGTYGNYSHVGKDEVLATGAAIYPLRRVCGDAYLLNLASRRWRKLPDLPFPIQGWEAVVYKSRYIILVGGIKNNPVDHPYQYRDKIPDISSPNFEVVVFDAVEETYRILPTPIPPYRIHPAKIKARGAEVTLHDVSKGGYRLASKLSLVGDKLYLCGGEVISPHNVTDEVVVGTILEG